MKDIGEYLQSGLIESYVLGLATAEESKEAESLASVYPAVREAIDGFSKTLEQHALANAVAPDPTIKPMLMATIDFIARMEKGERQSEAPELNENSNISDFADWLNRPDFVLPSYVTDVYARIINHTPQATTAVVWIKEMSPAEIHHDEYEKFLIVEGTCDITIEQTIHHLKSGDFLAIPLFANHTVKVTSDIPCKAILQRVAA